MGSEPLVLRAAWLLDGSGGDAVDDPALWIEDGRVVWAGPAAGLPEPATVLPILELPGCALLPGLVDAHVHLVASGGPELAASIPGTEAERVLAAIANARRHLDQGVTLVRDLGAPGAEAITLARAVEAGTVEGPRIVAAGPAITMTGGHIPYLGRVADGVEAVRTAVRANLQLGARCIKVVATGGVLTPGLDPSKAAYTQPELDALVAEAHRLGLRVAAHAIGGDGVVAALRAGVDSIEHGMILDAAAVEQLRAGDARYTPTFSAADGIIEGPSAPAWIKERARPAGAALVASFVAAVAAGVRVTAGTDAGTPDNPHGRVAQEAAFMVAAGLDPRAAVRAVTAEAADLLDEPDRGQLRPAAVADVVAVHGNPLDDIAALQHPAAVFQCGSRVR